MDENTLGKFKEIDGCDRLLILISQAVSAWLTLQRCCSRRSSVYEHSIYLPIIEVAKSQGWQVTHEKLMRHSKTIKGRKIDFVFEKGKEIASLEVKYMGDINVVPKSYFSSKNYIPKDIQNSTFFYEEKRKITQTSYVMICGYRQPIIDALPKKSRDKVCRVVYENAKHILAANEDNIFYEDGWKCDEIGENTTKMTVLVLRNRGKWHKI